MAAAARPSRRPPCPEEPSQEASRRGSLLGIRGFLREIGAFPYAEERRREASRSSHDRDAALLANPEVAADEAIGPGHRDGKGSWWVRVRGPVGSLVLHLLPLLLLINWQMSPPADIEPIAVQLVMEPPPPPAPEVKPAPPQPQPKPTPPPPRGRLASEDLGEPEAKAVDKPKGDAAGCGQTGKDRNAPGRNQAARKAATDRSCGAPAAAPGEARCAQGRACSKAGAQADAGGPPGSAASSRIRGIWLPIGRSSPARRRPATSTWRTCIR